MFEVKSKPRFYAYYDPLFFNNVMVRCLYIPSINYPVLRNVFID